ncbi:hypothetical protein J15TS10_49150 [Paenibacillus woosongensis]|uniref:Uncharacterized protein n=1 Tax=Paenibacillus woosongensis TaxID=307580 RepID=A0ABQ4MYU5_9BACL|nr:hypothetical protein J15TS10_49150 [Paenibacillus woosongensis]
MYLGDKVVYEFVGERVEGRIVRLFASDNNAALLVDEQGNERKVVCEYCKRIPRTNSLLTFWPLSDVIYTVLIYALDDRLNVYTFLGDELEETLQRFIKNDDELLKIQIYVRETASSRNSLYQIIELDCKDEGHDNRLINL